MKRPLKMVLFSPIVSIVSVYTALTYGLSDLVITTLTEVMEQTYHFGQGIVRLAFVGLCVFYFRITQISIFANSLQH